MPKVEPIDRYQHPTCQAVSRAYGQEASLRTLADAMAKVKFPTLPELPR